MWRQYLLSCVNIYLMFLYSSYLYQLTHGSQGNRYYRVLGWPTVLADICGSRIGHTHPHTCSQARTHICVALVTLSHMTLESVSTKIPHIQTSGSIASNCQVIQVNCWHLHKSKVGLIASSSSSNLTVCLYLGFSVKFHTPQGFSSLLSST